MAQNESINTISDLSDTWSLNNSGTYYRAMNPTPGTGIALANTTAFSDTACSILIRNTSASSANGPQIFLDYIKLIWTAAGTGALAVDFCHVIDPNNRYTSGGTQLTGLSSNTGFASGGASNPSVADIRVGAIVSSAAVAKRQLGRERVQQGINLGNVWVMNYGQATMEAQTTNAVLVGMRSGPVMLGPGGNHSYLLHCWAVGQSSAPSFEVEVGYWEF
jgi:hypothetical protein